MSLIQDLTLVYVRMKPKNKYTSLPGSQRQLEKQLRIYIIYSYMLTDLVIKSGEDI